MPGCKTIDESHSGDMETFFIRSRPCSGFGNYSPHTRFNCFSEQGVGGLEGHISLLALQPVPCLFGSCRGREGQGGLYIRILGL